VIDLTDEQRGAVSLVVDGAPRLACLTGGPGTGKTTTLRELLGAADAAGLRSACAAPSGKAAMRLEEATGRQAATLHRLMRARPGSREWAPIMADLLVVDEASMVDSPLMAATLGAAAAGRVRTVLLVGDADQLPPVGPGQPFHDLLAARACPSVRLTQIHRQAADSRIVQAAHAIRRGEAPEFNDADFRFVSCDELDQIPAACWDVAQSFGLDPDASQVLAPQRNTGGGVEAICDHFERSRPDDFAGGPELVRDVFRAGTKVINKKNDAKRGIFNGELGWVLEAQAGRSPGKDRLLVQVGAPDDRGRLPEHEFKGAGIKALRSAWALTVHSTQGSQWDDVVVVAHKAHTRMLTRRLFYVAATRAARRVWVVGQLEAVERAVGNVNDARRATWLGQRFARDKAARAARQELGR